MKKWVIGGITGLLLASGYYLFQKPDQSQFTEKEFIDIVTGCEGKNMQSHWQDDHTLICEPRNAK